MVLAGKVNMDDQSAIEELQRGTPGAAARIMQRHNQTLWRIARSILRNDSDAEEVVQEAYLRAFTGLSGFQGNASLGTWLARITINEALRRLGSRRVTTDIADLIEREPSGPFGDTFASPTPEQVAARSEIRRMVERAVDALPPPFRAVFVMRVLEQMTIEETAQALGIPEATVKTRLHRANEQLRRGLGSEFTAALEGAFPFAGLRCERLTHLVLGRLGWLNPKSERV
jgi:RNA polymerase sigma-70 factor (ECF subfamily)